MSFDGLHADAQFRRSLLVGVAFGNQLEQLHLSRSQVGVARLRPSGSTQQLSLTFGKKFRNERAEKSMTLVDFPNPLGQNACGGLFEQKSHGTGLRCVFDIRAITVRRENEYSGVGDGFENLTGGFQTIEQGHRDIHDDHCGTKFFDQDDRLTSIFRFADHFQIGIQFEHLAKPLAHNRMVFRQ